MKNKKPITIDSLRPQFTYDYKGRPLLSGYGIFEVGITNEEVDNYLRVYANTQNIGHIRNKLFKKMGCATCPVVVVNGKQIGLWYRHDISRYADYVLQGIPTYWD